MTKNEAVAVIFAGGAGKRMNSREKPKQFFLLHDKPIIIYTLEKFEEHELVDSIVVACIKEWIPYLESIVRKHSISKVRAIVPGGVTGQESIFLGLKAAEDIKKTDNPIVLIHDGVRPLIYHDTITDNIRSVIEHGSAITSVTVTETVLLLKDNTRIQEVPDRAISRLARAPQSFLLKDVLSAHKKAIADNRMDFIDTCSLMKYYGKDLYLVEGPKENIKITTPEDFFIMRAILDAHENAQMFVE